MKQRLLLFLSLILILSSCAAASDYVVDYNPAEKRGDSNLTVMTFNLHYYQPILNIWDRRKSMIETVVRQHGPDIVTFQEIFTPSHENPGDTTQLDWLHETFPEYTAMAAYDEKGTYFSPVPIFFKTALFELADKGFLFFTDTPDLKPGGRAGNFPEYLCNWVRLYDIQNDRFFYVYALHLPFLDTPGQDLALSLIEEKITGREYPEEPVILLGDFNMFSNSNLLERITNIGLANTLPGTEPGSYHIYVGITLFPRVDHIFVSDHFEVEKTTVSRYNQKGHYPSDHFPVISVIQW